MLELIIPPVEYWDEVNEEFVTKGKEQILELEHSLISLSKWESKWNKPFLTKEEKTVEETIDYIRCMTVNRNVDPSAYSRLTNDHIKQVIEYIDAPMTATTFNESGPRKTNREIITSEVIYYWMVALQIPFECQKWHLNRLITLVRICNIKNQPAKKMSRTDIMRQNTALNAARRKQLNSKG